MATTLSAAVIAGGALLAVSAPAQAATSGTSANAQNVIEPRDPSCGYIVTQMSVTNGSKIHTETPKCGQKVRAVVNCLKIGGASKVYGATRTTSGTSTAQCGSTAEATQRGYQKYISGSWTTVWF
ncbi:hypothetical protein ACWGSU_31655 [Streptomyces koyangensis]